MPWSGGVYTRGYPSWTNDANNNLAISATKFDTEDNDFAAGLNNCLTIDGLNKPNATLNWSQVIALTKGSDGTLLSVARTNGVNNPLMTIKAADSSNTIQLCSGTGSSGVAIGPSSVSFGNTSDNQTFAFLGTGAVNLGSITNNAAYVVTINAGPTGAAQLGVNDQGTELYALVANDSGGTIGGIPTGAGGVRNVAGHPFYVCLAGTPIFKVDKLANMGTQIADDAGTFFQAGYRGMPVNGQSANYTTVLQDRGKMIINLSGTHTFTIDSNANVAYSQGDFLTFLNANGAGNLTIAINTDTLVWAATGGTGSRTLAANGIATAVKAVNSTTWYISGTGLS